MNFMERIHLAILRAVQEKGIKIAEIEKATGINAERITLYWNDYQNLTNSDIQKLIDFLEIDINIRFPKEKSVVDEWIFCE